MAFHFDEYAQKGNSILKEVAIELGNEDIEMAGRMLRSVLRALRNRLTIEESFHLIGQLPMMLKAIYVDGWEVRMEPGHDRHIEEFRKEVIKEDDLEALKDFQFDGTVDKAILAVMKVLSRHVTASEIEEVLNALPGELRLILDESNSD